MKTAATIVIWIVAAFRACNADEAVPLLYRASGTARATWRPACVLAALVLWGVGPLTVRAGPLIEPTGTWSVGRVSVESIDRTRSMPASNDPRRLMLHIWYPTDSASSTEVSLPYMEGLGLARSALTDEEFALVAATESHSTAVAPALPTSRRFPVLLFSHGEQTNAFLYSNLHEDLASRGYVVVSVDHPGAALFVAYDDGSVAFYEETQDLSRRIAERAADLRFVRDRVRTLVVRGQRLEALASERVGVFGHSAGGIAGALLCQQPPLVDACLNLDGRLNAAPFVVSAGVPVPSRPLMYITKPFRTLADSELRAQGITREEATRTQADTWARDAGLLARSGPPSYRVTLRDAEHASFSDEPLLRDAEDAGSLELMTAIRDLVARFFDTTLTGQLGSAILLSDDGLEVEVWNDR